MFSTYESWCESEIDHCVNWSPLTPIISLHKKHAIQAQGFWPWQLQFLMTRLRRILKVNSALHTWFHFVYLFAPVSAPDLGMCPRVSAWLLALNIAISISPRRNVERRAFLDDICRHQHRIARLRLARGWWQSVLRAVITTRRRAIKTNDNNLSA